jgi:hypothetical protein
MSRIHYYSVNMDRVCLKYAVDMDNDNGPQLCGVFVRGVTEDITPLLKDHFVARIEAQIKAAHEFNQESSLQDESEAVK